jgi:hypothetical protein
MLKDPTFPPSMSFLARRNGFAEVISEAHAARRASCHFSWGMPQMLIEIVIVGCLHSNPNFCEDFRIPVEAEQNLGYGINPTLCTKFTTGLVQTWEQEHSTYFVKKWTCAKVVPKVTL